MKERKKADEQKEEKPECGSECSSKEGMFNFISESEDNGNKYQAELEVLEPGYLDSGYQQETEVAIGMDLQARKPWCFLGIFLLWD